jgi:hypothetical protein
MTDPMPEPPTEDDPLPDTDTGPDFDESEPSEG